MKKYLVIIFALMPLLSFAQEGQFKLTLKIADPKRSSQVYLMYSDAGKSITDSTTLSNGTAEFKGTLRNICRADLRLGALPKKLTAGGNQEDVLSLYLAKGKINIVAKDSVKYGAVSGSPINDQNSLYKATMAPLEQFLKSTLARWSKINHKDSTQNKLNDELASGYRNGLIERKQKQIAFIQAHPDFELSAIILIEVAGPIINLEKIEPLYNSLSDRVRQSSASVKIKNSLDILKTTSVGVSLPLFSQKDMTGKDINLADYRGKYVFVDFWASWCTPCREENPYILRALETYRTKLFEVVGISIDKDRNAWEKAVKHDKLTYTQILDTNVGGKTIAGSYGIQAIPQNFLVDPNGKIIAKNLRGEELLKKLKEIFGS